jgi:hypothetical protein
MYMILQNVIFMAIVYEVLELQLNMNFAFPFIALFCKFSFVPEGLILEKRCVDFI